MRNRDLEHVTELFEKEDFAKDLLFNSTTENQIENARSFLNIVQQKIKMLYIPTPIENV